jgi:hypothetical protein
MTAPAPAPPPRVAIMQPTFLPWLGYFALMDAVDAFVYLDDVQLSRQSWQTRNRLKGPQGEVMLSLPVARTPSRPLIHEAQLADRGHLRKMRRTVAMLLGRAPHFAQVDAILDAGFAKAEEGLCPLNTALIEGIATAVGITTPRLRASAIGLDGADDRGSRLRAICETLGAASYVSPPGAEGYLTEDAPFDGSPIALRFFEYTHPEYPQFHPPFLPFMAAIDALAHVGCDGMRGLIRINQGWR